VIKIELYPDLNIGQNFYI